MTTLSTIRTIALSATLLTCGTAPLLAEAPSAPTVAVQIAVLDLTRESDRRVLDRRIADAVEQVCTTGRIQSLPETTAMQACRRAASERVAGEVALLQRQAQVAAR